MPVAKTPTKPTIDPDKTRKEALEVLSPLQVTINSMKVTTELEYMQADALLGQVQSKKKGWLDKLNPIIKPMYDALQLIYALRTDVTNPYEQLEAKIKGEMQAYKHRELEKAREEQRKIDAEKARLEEEARKAQEAIDKAKTAPMKARLEDIKADLERKRLVAQSTFVAPPVKAAGSTARPVLKWRVVDIVALMKWITGDYDNDQSDLAHDDLQSLVTVDPVQMNAKFSLDQKQNKPVPLGIGNWMPGIEVYEDISITGRAR